MGLLDVLNGMQNGPRGPSEPDSSDQSSGGMSPITMAILALLAYKAVKHLGGSSSQPQTAPANKAPSAPPPQQIPGTTTASADDGGGLGGGLGNLGGLLGGLTKSPLGGALGGLLAGGAAGSVLSGGLSDVLKQLQDAGHGDTANSWVSNDPNKQISPRDLGSALGADQINTLSQQTGLAPDDLLSGLARQLPDVINQLTPHGRLPSDHETSRWI